MKLRAWSHGADAVLYVCRFAACLAGPSGQYMLQLQASSALLPWLSPLLKGIMQLAADIARLLQLMVLFAPVVCWAPLALWYGLKRPQWLRLFRYAHRFSHQQQQQPLQEACLCMPNKGKQHQLHMAAAADRHGLKRLLRLHRCSKL